MSLERESLLEKKVVIIGIGIAGAVHARALEDVPGVVLIAGIDTSSRTLTFRGNKAPMYPSVFEMMSESKPHPDIVVVATPTQTHARVIASARVPAVTGPQRAVP